MTDGAKPVAPEPVSRVFCCSICNQVAGEVQLLRPGARRPPTRTSGDRILAELDEVTKRSGGNQGASFAVHTFFGTNSGPVSGAATADAVEAALWAGDAPALHAICYAYAPFCCPECAAVYCGAHWRHRHFEDDRMGFSGIEGWCPKEHFHVLLY